MRDFRLDLITRELPVIGVLLLLVNDFYLKYEHPSFLTGKLSDVVGLFVFPYFIAAIRTNWSKVVYLVTAGLFIFWKSIYSQVLIELCCKLPLVRNISN